jgi:uncharacterized phage protein (TIGR02220 family)
VRLVEIKVKNWAKHNPATRAKTHSWFKMSNDFFTDPDFYRATLEARTIWLFIMCSASKKTSDTIRLNTQMAADSLNVRLETVDYALNELVQIGCILVTNSNDFHLRALESKDSCTEERREEKKREEEKREEKSVIEIIDVKKILPEVKSEDNLKSNDFCRTVITMLNSFCGSTYPVTEDYCKLIDSRKLDGYKLEDFKAVIKFRQATWATDPKMRQWLRPETLFGAKFYSYLEQSKNTDKAILGSNTGNPYKKQLEEIRKNKASNE